MKIFFGDVFDVATPTLGGPTTSLREGPEAPLSGRDAYLWGQVGAAAPTMFRISEKSGLKMQ